MFYCSFFIFQYYCENQDWSLWTIDLKIFEYFKFWDLLFYTALEKYEEKIEKDPQLLFFYLTKFNVMKKMNFSCGMII